ncbi:MAG: T9SS type A sorting domain-containing protein [Flavobacteriales bacterium]|nr:T9SS type A sorting domain-containing protein [Flavobacteriales bacterium]
MNILQPFQRAVSDQDSASPGSVPAGSSIFRVPNAMRTLSTLLLITITLLSSGQDWALINPAYRYNYSDDGTDTISNQIRVMEVDTLGVDSVLYTLNRIAFLCDSCPASLGGLCDGCFMWVDQPQFLRGSALHTPGLWTLMDPDTLLLLVPPVLGQNWAADPTGTVTAAVVALEEDSYLGELDSIATIATSGGDTLVLSRSYGLVRMVRSDGTIYAGIGVEGPELGELFPDPIEFFQYNSGDVLQYHRYGMLMYGSDWREFNYYIKTIYGERVDSDTGYTISFTRGYYQQWFLYPEGVTGVTEFGTQFFPMQPEYPMDVILESYPKELLQILDENGNIQYSFAANRNMNDQGLHQISSIEDSIEDYRSYNTISEYPTNMYNNLYPLIEQGIFNEYIEGIGLYKWGFESYFEPRDILILSGSCVNGDTIGSLIPDAYFFGTLGMNNTVAAIPYHLISTLCDKELLIKSDSDARSEWTIIDLHGRHLKHGTLRHSLSSVDVGSLATGTYVFMASSAQGQWSQRFVVAR